MKSLIIKYMVLFPSFFGLVFFLACSKGDENGPAPYFQVDGQGNSSFNGKSLKAAIANMELEDLSSEEQAGLLFMREEEKLAHDMYTKLYELWGNQVMINIANSELTHTEAVQLLISRYQLMDPAEDNGPGVYENGTLQQLYNDLLSSGSIGEIDALEVGGVIEEIDILDLQEQIDKIVDNADITLVYQNLLKGSRNHLRAFVRNLSKLGVDYSPRYLSAEVFDAIISGEMEKGLEGI